MKRLQLSAFAILAAMSISSGATANLFTNGGFEEVPNAALGQGLLPSNWVAIVSSADTYSTDGSYGLWPGEFGNFPGVNAHGGVRWVAGANINQPAGGEVFGQTLGASLVPGVTYQVDGWLHQALRFDLNNPGGYDLWLDTGDFGQRLYVGHLGDTVSPTAGWTFHTELFVAPTNASEYTRFVFAPLASGGWGTYPGLDDVRLTAVPEPMSLVAVIGGLTLFLRKRR